MDSQSEQITTNMYVKSYQLLLTAKTTIDMQQDEIDELREQNIIMRKVMVLIDQYSISDPDIGSTCAWCGGGDEAVDPHDDSCLVLAVRILLPTIPEIK